MKRRHFFWIAVFSAVLLLFVLALRPRPVEVDLGVVTKGPFAVTVAEEGETRVRELYLISAPLGGRLERVALEPGDRIEHDQILAEIVPVEPNLLDVRSERELMARANAVEAALEGSINQLEIAGAEAEKAQRYYDRDVVRLQQGNISAPMLEDSEHALRIARANLAAAQSSVKVAEFEVEQARAALLHSQASAGGEPGEVGRFTIRSPVEGVVLRRFQESSTVLGSGEPILEIGDPDKLEVRVDVLSQDAVRIRPGQPILIEHWGGDGTLSAWVRRVEPAAFAKVSALGVEEKRVWVYGNFSVDESPGEVSDLTPGEFAPPDFSPEPGPLGDAYRIEARIVVYEREEALRLPAGALFREGRNEDASWAAFRVDAKGRAELVRIEPGQRNDLVVEVHSGLGEGERVVLHPGDKVRSGVLVRERGRGDSGGEL